MSKAIVTFQSGSDESLTKVHVEVADGRPAVLATALVGLSLQPDFQPSIAGRDLIRLSSIDARPIAGSSFKTLCPRDATRHYLVSARDGKVHVTGRAVQRDADGNVSKEQSFFNGDVAEFEQFVASVA